MNSPEQKFPGIRYALFLAAIFACFMLDIASKTMVFNRCGLPGCVPEYWLIPNVLGIQTSLNEGALFGMGQGFSFVFCAISIVAVILISVWLFVFGNARSLFWTLTLGMMTGGVLGNMFDRLGLHGIRWPWDITALDGTFLHKQGDSVFAVRDWILVMLGSYHWPNFNLADSFLVVGAALILIHVFFFEKTEA